MFSFKKISRSGSKFPVFSSLFVVVLLCVSGAFVMANTDSGSDATEPYTVTDGCLFINTDNSIYFTLESNLGTLYTFTTCIIKSGVTSIENYAFYNCTSLISIIIPSSVTYIGEMTFEGCTGLTSIIIPSSVTEIAGYAFQGCTNLANMYCCGSSDSIEYVGPEPIPKTCTISYDVVLVSVSFDVGSIGVTAPSSQTIPMGSCATDPVLIVDGYTVEWYSDSALTTEFDYTSAITADTTIYLGMTAVAVDPSDLSDIDSNDSWYFDIGFLIVILALSLIIIVSTKRS